MSVLLWFVAGLVAGLLLQPSDRLLARLGRLIMFTVYGVVVAQGLYLGSTPSLQETLATTALHGLLFAVVVSLSTLLVAQFASRTPAGAVQPSRAEVDRLLLANGLRAALLVLGLLVASTLAGATVGERLGALRSGFNWPLQALLLAIGVETGIRRRELGEQLRSLRTVAGIALAALTAAVLAGLLLSLLLPQTLPALVSGAMGCGFYSVSGPLITELAGPDAGAVVLLGNLLRESIAMCIIGLLPALGIRPEAAIALGGATAMDSTLPFLSRAYGPHATLRAIGVGFVLSLIVPVLVPASFWLLQKLSSG